MTPEPDFVALTVRRLKPGTYGDWRKAWHDPDDPDSLWLDQESKAYIAVNVENPDEVVAFGFFHGKGPELLLLREDPEIQRKQAKRSAAMSDHVDATLSDGSYRVVEVITREEGQRKA
jgi:hypothetical protein